METRTITVIPKKERLNINLETGTLIKRKVCAYARVSTDLEDQKNSFNAQLEEYKSRISKNPEWDFVGLYSDEGISGTSTKKREGFKSMIEDAKAGKIDLILVKSISRFARNTVDCLKTVRELKAHNVEVFFDKENISSSDEKTDIMLTIFASFAQEESKSISENVKWGVRKRMLKGQRKMETKTLIGYEETSNGDIVINEAEKEFIKRIFNMYITGYTLTEITKVINEEGFKTRLNKEFKIADIQRILNNEKYCGDLILQKTVVVDFLEHRAVQNDGIVDKVHIQNHHEAIISREEFTYLQALKKYRFETLNKTDKSNINMLNNTIYCEECLRTLKKIKQHPKTEYERIVMTCKQDKKTSVNYVECKCSSTLDYELAFEASKYIFKKYYKLPYNFKEKIIDVHASAGAIGIFYENITNVKKEIADLELELKMLLKKQLEEDDFSKYESDFAEIKRKINVKKQLQKQYEVDEMKRYSEREDSLKIQEYLDSNVIAPSLFKTLVKAIIYKKDKSLRFILADDEISITRESCDSYLEMTPFFKDSIVIKTKQLDFDVIDLRGDKHEN